MSDDLEIKVTEPEVVAEDAPVAPEVTSEEVTPAPAEEGEKGEEAAPATLEVGNE